jgi:hypothetical protein
MQKNELRELVRELVESEKLWHNCGSLSIPVLDAIVEHCSNLDLRNSVETGCGRSTVLFSQMSRHHTVFAIDSERSISRNAISSGLLRKETVEFIEGPTQQTIPRYTFKEKLQAALIDGPHGYPFPDLEYYHIYPHLDSGSILIIDDIDIPTVRNMFNVLRKDNMFQLVEVVRTTAFLKRTDAPVFDPKGDGWWLQGYNRRKAIELQIARTVSRVLPQGIIRLIRKMRGNR